MGPLIPFCLLVRPELHVAAVFKAGFVVASRIAATSGDNGAAAKGSLSQINAALFSALVSSAASSVGAPVVTSGDGSHVEAGGLMSGEA